MQLLLILCIASAAVALPAIDPNREIHYHENIGIKEAARIKAAEEAMDFSGSRIVGGSNANLGAFPHMGGLVIQLNTGGTSVCGSSMISNTRAVTAAHCWWDGRNQARTFTVVYGSITLFSGGTRVNTNQVRMHPQWNPSRVVNDVAVVIHPSVGYNNNIRNIPLASGTNLFVGINAQAAGFGRQSDNAGIGSGQRLHHVTLPVISNAECARTFLGLPATNLCTSGAGGRSVCGGDSGGPLAVNNQLIGIVSFGHRDGCQRGFPQAFARVTSYNAWIRAQ